MQRTNFKMEYENITMTKGDTVAFNVEFFDKNWNHVTGDTAIFTCKKRLSGEVIFQKSIGNGISQSQGMMNVRIAPEDTKEIDEGIYFYDFCVGIENDVYTIAKGSFTVEWDATY